MTYSQSLVSCSTMLSVFSSLSAVSSAMCQTSMCSVTLTSLRCVASRSRKREHLQTLQVRLGDLEKENARLTQKLAQQDAELDKFRQGLPSHQPGKQVWSLQLPRHHGVISISGKTSSPTAGLLSKRLVWLPFRVLMAHTFIQAA